MPAYESSSASDTCCSTPADGCVSSVPSNAIAAAEPLPSAIAFTAPRRCIATASS